MRGILIALGMVVVGAGAAQAADVVEERIERRVVERPVVLERRVVEEIDVDDGPECEETTVARTNRFGDRVVKHESVCD